MIKPLIRTTTPVLFSRIFLKAFKPSLFPAGVVLTGFVSGNINMVAIKISRALTAAKPKAPV
ncbi:hypothetical protein D3C80_1945090 [compost metagenome]